MKKPPIPESFLPLKPHWFHVLLSLAGEEQHGYGIMQEVLDRTAGKVRLWPATLHGTRERLMAEDMVEESDKRPAPEMDDAGAVITGSPGSAGACWRPKVSGSKTWSA